jgi:adenylate cyclase
MNKQVLWLILVIAAISFLGVNIYNGRALFNVSSYSPLHSDLALESLNKAAANEADQMYIISQAKESFMKLAPDGTIAFKLDSERKANESLEHYNAVAADDEGNSYVIRTQLDSYGLYVKSERIEQLDPLGNKVRTLFEVEYGPETKLLRVGKLRSIQYMDGKLSFFSVYRNTIEWFGLTEAGERSVRTSITLPDTFYVSDITGSRTGDVFFTTKNAEIYKLPPSGVTEQLLAASNSSPARRTVPEELVVEPNGKLIYLDFDQNAVMRLDPADKSVTKVVSASSFGDMVSLKLFKDSSIMLITDSSIVRLGKDGKPTVTYESATFSDSEMTKRWKFWVINLLTFLLVIYAIRYLYVRIMNRRLPLMLKQMLIFVPVIVAALFILAYVVYSSYSAKLEEAVEKDLALMAHNGSNNLVNGDTLAHLTNASQFMNDDYRTIKQRMASFFDTMEANRDGIYNTLYKFENGKLYVLMDDDDSVNMFNPYPLGEDTEQLIAQRRGVTGRSMDSTGYWMYAISPIFNSKSEIVGIYETGKDMNGFRAHQQAVQRSVIRSIGIMALVIILLFALISYFLLSSIRKLRNSVTEVAAGNLDTSVHITSRDEVGDLGDSFNLMADSIRSHIANMVKVNDASNRFVPQQFVKFLGKDNLLDLKLGEQVESEMAVMTMNMHAFFELSKDLTPRENFNSFLKRFCPTIRTNGGMINKYLGVGMLALFPERSEDAIRSAIEMRRSLEVYNGHRSNFQYRAIDIGIGIHRGSLMLGIIGEEARLEGSVISDNVNLSSMLEKACHPLGSPILITDSIVKDVADMSQFHHRCIGYVQLEGKNEPVLLYDVFEGDPETIRVLKARTKLRFEQAVDWYQNGRFYDAREAFLDVIKQNRWDKAARLYFYLCDEYNVGGASEDWNGALHVS